MVAHNRKNQNTLNSFLSNYFNAVLAAILILFLGGAYLFFLGPKFRETEAAIQQNIEEQQMLYENQQKKLANLKSILELYKKINSVDLQRFNGVLPDEYVPEKLFGELEEIINQGGWLLTSVQLDRLAPEETFKPLTISSVGGPLNFKDRKIGSLNLELFISAIDYPGLKRLLRLLENNLRLFDVTSVKFSPSANRVIIILKTYYYQATPTAPAPAAISPAAVGSGSLSQ